MSDTRFPVSSRPAVAPARRCALVVALLPRDRPELAKQVALGWSLPSWR